MFDYSRKPVKWQVGNFSFIISFVGDPTVMSLILGIISFPLTLSYKINDMLIKHPSHCVGLVRKVLSPS